jgi:SAM-dependent methyltransferase
MRDEMTERPVTVDDPQFWEGLYQHGHDRWELGDASPALAAHLQKSPLPRGRVAVLGCGRGHDARLFARLGYEIWAFDFAAPAIAEATALAERERLAIYFEQRDLFTLAADYHGFFDGVWEYTCFCAIDPARRPEYVNLVKTLLKPTGWYLACFWPLGRGTDGPPFPTTQEEIRRLFEPHFTFVETYLPTNSPDRRKELEWMVVARPGRETSRPSPSS